MKGQKLYGSISKFKNLGEYHDLHLKTDVLLLADIFENFRDVCMKYYGLDPAYYCTLPNFAFDAMLKMTGVEIDLIYDQEMYEMIEAGLRGGMCMVSTSKKLKQTINTWVKNMMKVKKAVISII